MSGTEEVLSGSDVLLSSIRHPLLPAPHINVCPVSLFLIMLGITPGTRIPFLLSTYYMQDSVYLRMRLKIKPLLL